MRYSITSHLNLSSHAPTTPSFYLLALFTASSPFNLLFYYFILLFSILILVYCCRKMTRIKQYYFLYIVGVGRWVMCGGVYPIKYTIVVCTTRSILFRSKIFLLSTGCYWIAWGLKWIKIDKNAQKIGLKMGPKKRGPRPPGRGVLHFSAQAYRNPVQFLAFFVIFSKIGAI